jgi:hypothetical protein
LQCVSSSFLSIALRFVLTLGPPHCNPFFLCVHCTAMHFFFRLFALHCFICVFIALPCVFRSIALHCVFSLYSLHCTAIFLCVHCTAQRFFFVFIALHCVFCGPSHCIAFFWSIYTAHFAARLISRLQGLTDFQIARLTKIESLGYTSSDDSNNTCNGTMQIKLQVTALLCLL